MSSNVSDPSTAWTPPSNGIAGGYNGDSRGIDRVMMSFSAIAWYNAAELIVLIMLRFKRRSGLYFWSLMITALAIIVYQVGIWLKMVNIGSSHPLALLTVENIGWIFMVGGNSFILYSRLHLITLNQILLRVVFYFIIVNTIVLYIPTTTLNYGCQIDRTRTYCNGYDIMERIQMTLFTCQEFAISGIYVVEAYRYLKIVYGPDGHTRRVIYELLCVNVILILLDVALLAVEYVNLYEVEVTFKGFVYSVKAKLELAVLSRLVKIVNRGDGLRTSSWTTANSEKGTGRHVEAATSQGGIDWLSRINSDGGTSSNLDTRGRGASKKRAMRQSFSLSSASDTIDQEPRSIDFVTRPLGYETAHPSSKATKDNGEDLASALRWSNSSNPEITMPASVLKRDSSRHSSISNMYPGKLAGTEEPREFDFVTNALDGAPPLPITPQSDTCGRDLIPIWSDATRPLSIDTTLATERGMSPSTHQDETLHSAVGPESRSHDDETRRSDHIMSADHEDVIDFVAALKS